MARAFILSHGARVSDYPETFVPQGKTISFYSEYDQNTLRSIGLAALNAGDVQPTQTYTAGQTIPNYLLSRFEDEAIAQHLASHSSATNAALYFAGMELPSPTVLCTTPKVCVTTKPLHAPGCQGAFSKIAEAEIFSVSCRGVRGQQNQATREMEGSEEALTEWQTEAQRILTWAKTEPDAAMAYYQSLTDATKSILHSSNTNLKKFAEQYFAGGGNAVPEAVLQARRYLEAYGEPTFYDWSKQWTTEQREVILAGEGLMNAWLKGKQVRDQEAWQAFQAENPHAAADESAVLVTGLQDQSVAIAESVAQLQQIPVAEHTDDELAQLETAVVTFMTDAQSVQSLAGSPRYAHLLQSAIGVYDAGADAGVKLELHKEARDDESLLQLVDAWELVAQWVAALAAVPTPPPPDQGAATAYA